MRCVEGKVWQDPDTLFVINTDKLEHDNFMHTLANERNFLDSLAEIQDLNYMCFSQLPLYEAVTIICALCNICMVTLCSVTVVIAQRYARLNAQVAWGTM